MIQHLSDKNIKKVFAATWSAVKSAFNNKYYNTNFYKYNLLMVSVLPYFSICYYKSQGKTSIGCLRLNIQFGWLIFGGSITTKHRDQQKLEAIKA